MRRVALVASVVVITSFAANAQVPAAPGAPAQSVAADTSWHGWAALALGPGGANGEGRLAGDLGVWLTRKRVAVWVRDATVCRFLEPGDFWDISVLAGVHPATQRHSDFIAGAGIGLSRGHGTSGENLSSEPALAFGAQLNFNYRVIGAGFDAFATVSKGRSYSGLGLALALGWFR